MLLLHTNPFSSSLRLTWVEKWGKPAGTGMKSESEGEIRSPAVGGGAGEREGGGGV